MQLSKSEYMMFLKHPAWLWLKKHDKSKLPEPDENLQAIFDAGFEFEKYAEKLFPEGVRLSFENFKDYRSLPLRTDREIKKKTKTIFQGRFETENITCICDVLDRVKDGVFDLYEIKASTKVKPEHILDLAFQLTVLEKNGLEIRNINIIHVDGKYIKEGEIDIKKLTSIKNVGPDVREKIGFTKDNIKKAFETVYKKEIPDISLRHVNLGSFKDWMEIFEILKGEVDKYSIYNLIAPGAKRIGELEDIDVYKIEDIPENFKLTTKQQAQVETTKKNKEIIKKDNIRNFLRLLDYPLYFLDYETTNSVIPFYDKTRPYQQVPFQYSLHIIEKEGAEIKHFEYLHKEKTNPIPELASKLRKDIGAVGSVIVWSKSFEMRCNTEMGDSFPEFKPFLDNVNDRVVDLMEPFKLGDYAHKDFLGSSSIKKVLPVLAPDFSYKDLDIGDGETAKRLWTNTVIRENKSIDKNKLFSDLLKYCKLDTLAMVKIWEFLEKL